jgi:hypothetical protein
MVALNAPQGSDESQRYSGVGAGPDGVDAYWFAIEFVVGEASMPLLECGSRLQTGEVRTETVMHAMT